MAQRVTLRKRTPYKTTSNRRRVVKTPGGKLVYHHIKKLATAPKCGDCGIALPGVRPSFLYDSSCVCSGPTPPGVGPCTPSPPIRHDLEDEEDRSPGVRWFAVR